jgi:glutathione S-transferase
MLIVHHLGVSQSERIVWLCEELELPYELKVYDRDPVTRLAPADYKALHPIETAPVITDGPVVLGETGAIVDYILARYGEGRLAVAPDAPNFADYLFWLHFANGSLVPSEMSAWLGSLFAGGQPNALAEVVGSRATRAWRLVETRLGDVPYLAGEAFTAADIVSVFGLTTMRAFTGRTLDDYPNVRAYLARIGERPAYRRAMAKGDPALTPMLT